MMEDTEEPVVRQKRRDFDSWFKRLVEKPLQVYLDRWTPHTIKRWVVTFVLTVLFDLRIVWLQGWYIFCYALKIYHLNLFLAFLTPKIDPALLVAEDNGEGSNEVYILGHILSGTTLIFLINVEVGINVEGGIFWKKLVHNSNKRGVEGGKI